MAKFLFQGNYTTEGIRGITKEGGSSRVNAVSRLIGSIGGTLEAFYFTFGSDDFVIIADLANAADANVTAAAISMTVGATGAAEVRTTVLLTGEEIDRATKISVPYRAPGA